jgi:serine/threonine-protein kinase
MAGGPLVGGQVAEFTIESLLAEGSTGSVYLAEDTVRGGRVALKILHPALALDDRFRARFLRESRLAATLDDPHVVRTVAAGEADGVLYLAMEHIAGPDLRRVIQAEGCLDPTRALAIVGQVAAGLDAAHAAGLVHRDVKPGNILLDPQPDGERAAICDFGLARHVSSASSLTGDRGFVGTIDYVAPEQIEGSAIDGRGDVYALGCVLFECLTGEKPFERESDLAVVFAHLNEPPPRLAETDVAHPSALDDVFRIALAKRPADRYATCGELVGAARRALAGDPVPRRRRRTKRVALVGVGAVVASAAAAFAVVAAHSGATARRAAPSARPEITQTAIHGARLGLLASAYERLLVPRGITPGFGRAKDLDSGYTSIWFGRRKVAVYFAPGTKRGTILTTWNAAYRTAAGIGPCSTIEAMQKAYGDAVHPTWAGTDPKTGTIWSWAVGDNLLFNSENHRTITAVALYNGDPAHTRHNSPQAWANYISANERWCS